MIFVVWFWGICIIFIIFFVLVRIFLFGFSVRNLIYLEIMFIRRKDYFCLCVFLREE